jgi:hypothetical protein
MGKAVLIVYNAAIESKVMSVLEEFNIKTYTESTPKSPF